MSKSILDRFEIKGAPVKVSGLVKQFDRVDVVKEVSIDIKAGEFLALLGPSGSGKSTILMTIAGFEEPSSGEIFIEGRSVTHVSPNKRNIGMVFQKYALFPHMTVSENIAFPLKMRKIPKKEIAERVEQVIEMTKLHGLGSRRPTQLSGGQQQRVALARAIVFRPSVLLMDEPLGALDKKLREHMQLEIKHLQKSLGSTVIYVTHDQEEALTMADRIAVLNEGRLEQVGAPIDLYERPENSFVANFIGEMNFLDGKISEITTDGCLVKLDGELILRCNKPTSKNDSGVQIGSPVRVAVRPERIRLRSANETGYGESLNLFHGTLQEKVYAGVSLIYMVRLDAGINVVARMPNSGDGGAEWTVGDQVQVFWQPSESNVYTI